MLLTVTRSLNSTMVYYLAEVPKNKVKAIPDQFLFEDITDEYRIKTGKGEIDTSIPRITETGKVSAHPAYTGKDKKAAPAGRLM